MFNLSLLTEFNDALIYTFQPESTLNYITLSSSSFKDTLLPQANQHHDLLNAYLFAQNTILPQIRAEGLNKITAKDLLSWVNSLHALIGKSLLQDKAGRYSENIVYRWHEGITVGNHFYLFFSKLHPCQSKKNFIACLEKECSIDKKSAEKLITLLEKIAQDPKFTIPADQEKFLNPEQPNLFKGASTFYKLANAYHLNQLSLEEKKIVDAIVKICIFPKLIPEAMQHWAEQTLSKLIACDPNNLDMLSECLASTFYEFTEIHPFENANGRTATCLINIFLRAFNQPSIILRAAADQENKSSSYQQAIATINENRAALCEHIKTRILQAQNQPLTDHNLKKLILLRVNFSDLLQEASLKYSDFDMDAFQTKLYAAPELMNLALKMTNATEGSTYVLSYGLTQLNEHLKALKHKSENNAAPFLSSATPSQRTEVIEYFKAVTGIEHWKCNTKNALIAWLEIEDKEKAKKIYELLNILELGKLTLTQRSDNKIPVIKCEAIDFKKLSLAATFFCDREAASSEKRFN